MVAGNHCGQNPAHMSIRMHYEVIIIKSFLFLDDGMEVCWYGVLVWDGVGQLVVWC